MSTIGTPTAMAQEPSYAEPLPRDYMTEPEPPAFSCVIDALEMIARSEYPANVQSKLASNALELYRANQVPFDAFYKNELVLANKDNAHMRAKLAAIKGALRGINL